MNASSFGRVSVLALSAAALLTAPVAAQQKNPDLAPYLMADRNAEVALARTAAPKNVSDSATVLVLTRTGFVEASHGTNGFTCAVLRSFDGATNDPTFWSPKTRAPHCLNPAAARTVLPRILKRTEWIMSGVTPSEIDTRTTSAFASHEFVMPAAGAMAYMLSPQQILSDDDPHWMPHLMFYFDKSMPASAWGAAGFKAPIINGSAQPDPTTPVTTLLIPVPQWSDGTPASLH